MKNEVKKLFEAICEKENTEDAKFICDFMGDAMSSFIKYFNSVYRDVLQAQSLKNLMDMGHLDREEYIFRIQQNDDARRKAHDVAIDACAQINRQCERYGIEPICPGKDADRTQIAEFIGEVVCEYYQDGIKSKEKGNLMDKSVEKAQKSFVDPDRGYSTKIGGLYEDR